MTESPTAGRELQERLRRHQELKQLRQILACVGDVDLLEEGLGSLEQVEQCMRACFRWDAEPTVRVPLESPEGVVDWLRHNLASVVSGGEVLVSLGQVGGAGWVRLRVGEGAQWIERLWRCLAAKELFFASMDRRRVLVVTEEEYFYELYARDV